MIAGDADVLDGAAAALARTRGFADAAGGVDAAVAGLLAAWRGEAATAAGVALARVGPALAVGDEVSRALAPVLQAYAAELRAADEQRRAAPTGDATVGDAAVERLRLADEQAAGAVARVHDQLAAMTATPPEAAGPSAPPPADADEPGLLSTLGHTALDLAGLVPVVGEAADVANAAWYGLEGDYLAAGLSLAAAIPIAGWAFTGGKLGLKGVDTVKAVTDAGGAAAWVKGRPSMVPWNAERLPYKGVGEAFRWKDPATGKTVKYHGHPVDPTAPNGSNSSSGPTYRIRVGTHYVDAHGTRYTDAQLTPGSPRFSPQGADDTHIPYPTNQPVGWDAGRRVFVPNAVSLADGTGEQGGSVQ